MQRKHCSVRCSFVSFLIAFTFSSTESGWLLNECTPPHKEIALSIQTQYFKQSRKGSFVIICIVFLHHIIRIKNPTPATQKGFPFLSRANHIIKEQRCFDRLQVPLDGENRINAASSLLEKIADFSFSRKLDSYMCIIALEQSANRYRIDLRWSKLVYHDRLLRLLRKAAVRYLA